MPCTTYDFYMIFCKLTVSSFHLSFNQVGHFKPVPELETDVRVNRGTPSHAGLKQLCSSALVWGVSGWKPVQSLDNGSILSCPNKVKQRNRCNNSPLATITGADLGLPRRKVSQLPPTQELELIGDKVGAGPLLLSRPTQTVTSFYVGPVRLQL